MVLEKFPTEIKSQCYDGKIKDKEQKYLDVLKNGRRASLMLLSDIFKGQGFSFLQITCDEISNSTDTHEIETLFENALSKLVKDTFFLVALDKIIKKKEEKFYDAEKLYAFLHNLNQNVRNKIYLKNNDSYQKFFLVL